MVHQHRLIDALPSDQNVVDLFAGEWASRLPPESGLVSSPGQVDLFHDARIAWACEVLGPVEGMNVLELGPLEGGHSYMLEQRGIAANTAIEANSGCYLKCLCVKELLGLTRTRFKLGSFIPFLETCGRYDLIVASGVLYHMTDPLHVLELLAARTDRLFLWTHYYDDQLITLGSSRAMFAPPQALPGEGLQGTEYRGAVRRYHDGALAGAGWCGGLNPHAIWLERESILNWLKARGFTLSVAAEDRLSPAGPSFAVCAQRLG